MLKLLKNPFYFNRPNSFKATKSERDALCEIIINSSAPKAGFYLLLILSTFIVTVGLLKNSVILTIGGMLVAPLLSPILSLSLSLTIMNFKVFLRSIRIFVISALVSLFLSYLLGLIIDFSLSKITLLDLIVSTDLSTFLIPVAAGAAASFTWAKKEMNNSLPGVAITVALLPPLTIMGLSLAAENYLIFKQALNIYFLNVSGIIIGSLIIFIIMGFYKSAKKIIGQVNEEENN